MLLLSWERGGVSNTSNNEGFAVLIIDKSWQQCINSNTLQWSMAPVTLLFICSWEGEVNLCFSQGCECKLFKPQFEWGLSISLLVFLTARTFHLKLRVFSWRKISFQSNFTQNLSNLVYLKFDLKFGKFSSIYF